MNPLSTHRSFRLQVFFLSGALALSALGGIHSERWRWSNPVPHGNNVMDMLVTSDLAVQVGDAGALYVQQSDGRWAPARTGTEAYLRSTALLGSRILAVGEGGCMLWSDDGTAFEPAQLVPLNTLDWFEGVAAAAHRAVAVGDNGTIYTTTNGTLWEAVNSGTTEWLRGAASGSGAFVAVGENGTILRASSNGTAWSPKSSGTTEHLNRVRFLGAGGSGRFYAVGNGGVLLSSLDGNTWTSLSTGTTNDLFDVALNNSGLLIVGDQELRVSTDGGAAWVDQIGSTAGAAPAWTYLSAHGRGDRWLAAGRTGLLMEGSLTNGTEFVWAPSPSSSSHAWVWDLTVDNGICIAVGDLADIKTSLDGILWDQEAVPAVQSNTVLLGVGGTSNLVLAVGSAGTVLASEAGFTELVVTNGGIPTNLTVQTFGVVWSNVPPFTTASLQGIDAAEGLFLTAGDDGRIFSSSNGWNWTEQPTPTTAFLSGVAIGPGACVAVGSGGTLLRGSAFGTDWTAVALGTTNWIYRVRWLGDRFVAVGENGSIFTSPDAFSWTQRNSGTVCWLTDAALVDGQWFVCGYQGTLLSSSNLSDWAALPLPTGKSLFAAAEKEGRLLLAGVEGITLRNQIVPRTEPVTLLDYSQSSAADSNAVDTVYELFLFGGLPDQFFELQSCTNLCGGSWTNVNGALELFDPSGTIYAIRTRDATNAPPAEYYRTQLIP